MDYKFVDTNIFIEIFIRFGKKSDKSKKLIQSGSGLYTNILVLSEIIWVFSSFYKLDKKLTIKYLKKIISSNIEIENKKTIINTINYYEANNVDWTDCLNMFLAREQKIDEVYSYDRGLDKFDWVKRLEP